MTCRVCDRTPVCERCGLCEDCHDHPMVVDRYRLEGTGTPDVATGGDLHRDGSA